MNEANVAAIGPDEARMIVDFGAGPAGVGPAYSIDSGDFFPSRPQESSADDHVGSATECIGSDGG